MKISKMKKIVIVVLFSLTIISLPTYIRCKNEKSSQIGDENYPDQIAMESNWRPIFTPEIEVQQQNHSIHHIRDYPSQVVDLIDLDPLAAAASAQEYVEKALEIQSKIISEKSDHFPAHSFSDYKSYNEPSSEIFPVKRKKSFKRKDFQEDYSNHRPRHRNSESRRVNSEVNRGPRKQRKNHDEASLDSERVPKKIMRQHSIEEPVESEYIRPKNRVKLTDTIDLSEVEGHQVTKKHKLNYFDQYDNVPKLEAKRKPKIKQVKQHVEPEQAKTPDSMTEIIADWAEHFKNIKAKDSYRSESVPIDTLAETTPVTTIRPKKRIRTKRPNHDLQDMQPDLFVESFANHRPASELAKHKVKVESERVANHRPNDESERLRNHRVTVESERITSRRPTDESERLVNYRPVQSKNNKHDENNQLRQSTEYDENEQSVTSKSSEKLAEFNSQKLYTPRNKQAENNSAKNTPSHKEYENVSRKRNKNVGEGTEQNTKTRSSEFDRQEGNREKKTETAQGFRVKEQRTIPKRDEEQSYDTQKYEQTFDTMDSQHFGTHINEVRIKHKPTKEITDFDNDADEGKINLKIEKPLRESDEMLSNHETYISKSKTVENADYSTSTNYYYEPIVSEVIEEPNSQEMELITRLIFRNRTLNVLKPHSVPTNDHEAYFMSHPTPNPPTTSSGSSSSFSKPKLLYHPTPARSHKNKEALNASIYTNSDSGVESAFRPNRPLTLQAKVKQQMNRPTAEPDIYEAAESQIVRFRVTNQTVTPVSSEVEDNNLKPHTPNFLLNEFKQAKTPIYYGNTLFSNTTAATSLVNTTTDEERFKSFFSSTVASIIEDSLLKPVPTDQTDRSLMTFAPDDDIDDSTVKIDNNDLEKDPMEAAESGKNQYVVLYEYEDKKSKRKVRPRVRPTPKQQLVTQQIHYHHHGNPSPPTQNKHSMGGNYQGTYGDKGPYDNDNDDDDGPDVTHTHHEYVHFDNEPSITHMYNDGPLTDHYNVANPGANAVYDLKSARDYDFRHTASHDLDTRHVPVPDFDNLRYSHHHNAGQQGRVERPLNFNSYGERPYYYYDSERQSDLYDLEAYGSSPQENVVKPVDQLQIENQQNKLKITDPLNPTQTIEITKDEYVRHVKLAVEKYLKSKDQRTTTNTPPTPHLQPIPISNQQAGIPLQQFPIPNQQPGHQQFPIPNQQTSNQQFPGPNQQASNLQFPGPNQQPGNQQFPGSNQQFPGPNQQPGIPNQQFPNQQNEPNPFFNNNEKPFDNGNAIIAANENEATVFVKAKPFPSPDLQPPSPNFQKPLDHSHPITFPDGHVAENKIPLQGFQKPLERPLNYHEGHITENKVPLNDDTYRHLRESLDQSYLTPIKPITLPPKKINQLTRLVASTPAAFQPRPIPSIRPQHPSPNFNIMKNLRYPKGTYAAGKPLADAIYNMQESLGNDVDLTTKHLRPNGRPIDISAIDVGSSYVHGNTNFDGNTGPPNSKLRFNNHVYHDINHLQNGKQSYKDSVHAQSSNYPEIKQMSSKKHAHDSHSIAHNSATLSNELNNAPVQIINGVPFSNPYNIDMDTLRFMLGGMPQGMTMTKDPNDPYNMQTLKSIPNIATVGNQNFPTSSTAFSSSFSKSPKPNNFYSGAGKHQRPQYHKAVNKAIHHHPNQPGLINHNPKSSEFQNQMNIFQNQQHFNNNQPNNKLIQKGFGKPPQKNFGVQPQRPTGNQQMPNTNNHNPIFGNTPSSNHNFNSNVNHNPMNSQNFNTHNANNKLNNNPSFNNHNNNNNNNNPNNPIFGNLNNNMNFNNNPNFNANSNNAMKNNPNNSPTASKGLETPGRSENGFVATNGYPDPEFHNMNAKWNHFTPNSNPFHTDPSQTPPPWLRDNTNLNSFNAARPSQNPQLYQRTYRRVAANDNNNKISSKLGKEPETSIRPPPRFRRKSKKLLKKKMKK